MTKNNKNFFKNKKHSGRGRKLFLPLCLAAAFLFIISAVIFIAYSNRDTETDPSVKPDTEEIPPLTEEPSVSDNDTEPEKPPVSYPKPEYNLTLEEIYVPLENISREYRIAWVSDLHLITAHEPGGISDGSLVQVIKRYNTLAVTQDGVHAEELWPDIVKCLNTGDYDAVIFGGDMMDYCSVSNMNALKEGYENLRYDKDQILYIRADHDYGAWYVGDNFTQLDIYDLHEALDGDDPTKKYLDMGEFVVIGINNSTQNITEENLSIVESQYEKAAAENKPVIAVTHVPYGSDTDPTLETLSMEVRNKEYYWFGQWQPNEPMQRYLDLLFCEDTQVKQVLAGHLHAPWDGMITKQLREHIFSPAFGGTIGVIHFVPEGTDADTSTYHTRKYYS
ncbi:MAG: metallophosphoesterase [Lachnospiraceae bacterium]|nr:metallophosphoesterase [Lachnospiraceae bacterium]